MLVNSWLLIDRFVVELNLRLRSPNSGKVLLARIETITLSRVFFAGCQSKTQLARGACKDLSSSHSYTNHTQGGLVSVNHQYTWSWTRTGTASYSLHRVGTATYLSWLIYINMLQREATLTDSWQSVTLEALVRLFCHDVTVVDKVGCFCLRIFPIIEYDNVDRILLPHNPFYFAGAKHRIARF